MPAPQYVNEISDVYAEMYTPTGNEKPLMLQEKALDVEETPPWKKLLRHAAKKQNRKQPPYTAHVEPREDATEEEEGSNKDYRAGAKFKLIELVGQISRLKEDYIDFIQAGDPLFDVITQIEEIKIN